MSATGNFKLTNVPNLSETEKRAQYIAAQLIAVVNDTEPFDLIRGLGEVEAGAQWGTMSAATRQMFRKLAERLP